jgi:hypothetical protein
MPICKLLINDINYGSMTLKLTMMLEFPIGRYIYKLMCNEYLSIPIMIARVDLHLFAVMANLHFFSNIN